MSVHGIAFALVFFFLILFYRTMPRVPSDVWIHFSSASVEGKTVDICKHAYFIQHSCISVVQ